MTSPLDENIVPANGFQPVDKHRLPSGCRGDPGGGCIRSFGSVMCSVVRSRRDTAFALVVTSVEDSDLSGGNVGEGSFGRFVRSCRQLYGAWRASLARL